METLFRKVLVSERVPNKEGTYTTNLGLMFFNGKDFDCYNTKGGFSFWLEPVELPSEEEIKNKGIEEWYTEIEYTLQPFLKGANYILGLINSKK